jgi:hypothetical protein
MASITTNRYKYELLKAVSGHTFKFALFTGAVASDPDLDIYSDFGGGGTAGGAEVSSSGTGYTTGGATLTGVAASQEDTSNEGRLTFNAPSWGSSTISATWGMVYDTSTSPANAVVAVLDFGGTITSTNGTFTCTPGATGVLALT